MAEPTKNGILEYLESVSSDNPETFTEYQEGIGREGFRKYIPDPFQVSDYLTDNKNGIRTLAPDTTPPHDEQAFMDEYYKGTGKSSDVAIGALGTMALGVPFIRAQKVANTLQTQKNIKNPTTFANLIEQGFFKDPAKVTAEFEKQIGRLGKGGMGLAGTAWLSKFGPQNIPEHDEQALMDEYYGEYPEKSTDTALGILSAFPVANTVKLANLLRNPAKAKKAVDATFPNMFKDPAMKPFLQLLGLQMGFFGVEDEKYKRRKKEAEEMGLDSVYDHPELQEFQKKANGGSIYEAEKSYDYDPALWKTSALPMLKGLASLFLPQDAADVALMTTPLWWMKSLKTGSKAYKKAEKLQKKVDKEKFDYNREMKNAPYDGDPAYQAAWGHQQNIAGYNDQIKKIIRKGGNPTGGKGISSYTGKKYYEDAPKEVADHYTLRQQGLNPPDDDLLRTIVDIVTPD